MTSNHGLRSVEIFAGAAGLGIGLARAGFNHEVVVENDNAACETIRLNQANNHPLVKDWDVREASIENCDLSDIETDPDLVAGGPPCQGFSIGGKHKGSADERNLWPWAIQTVAILKPKAFVFENVPNLASGHKDYFDYLVNALALPTIADPHSWEDDQDRLTKIIATGQSFDPSYRVNVSTHLAADHGTGQKRKRLFIVGIRDDLGVTYNPPMPTHSLDSLMEDKWQSGIYWERHAMQRPDIDAAGLRWLKKHNRQPRDLFSERLSPWQTVRDVLAQIPSDAPNSEPAPREAKGYKGHTGSPVDEPSKTHRAGVHGVPGGENMMDWGSEKNPQYEHYSVRQAAALSDFPHDYQFSGTWSDGIKQIGNAVCANQGQVVGQQIAAALAA